MECYISLCKFSIIIIVNGNFHSSAWGWGSGVELNPKTHSRTPQRNEWSVKYNPCIPLACISTHILVMMKRYGPRHRNSFHTIPCSHICRNYGTSELMCTTGIEFPMQLSPFHVAWNVVYIWTRNILPIYIVVVPLFWYSWIERFSRICLFAWNLHSPRPTLHAWLSDLK